MHMEPVTLKSQSVCFEEPEAYEIMGLGMMMMMAMVRPGGPLDGSDPFTEFTPPEDTYRITFAIIIIIIIIIS